MKLNKNIIFLIAAVSLISLKLQAQQEWKVPEEKKKKASSFTFTQQTNAEGEAIFMKNCKSCHGEPGKANFAKMTPVPGDVSTERFQKQLDGDLFFKITTGRAIMPSFKNVLGEEDRWKLVGYIRSFNKAYVQPPLGAPSTGCKDCKTKIQLAHNKEKKQIKVTATGILKGEAAPMPEAEVSLFVKRYFGSMQIGKQITTDASGVAVFNFPDDLPGDKEGNIVLIAKLTEEKMFGESQDTVKMQIGIPTNKPALNEHRAMWNVVTKAPWWILFTYLGVVMGVMGVIFYIMLQLKKLKEIGDKTSNE